MQVSVPVATVPPELVNIQPGARRRMSEPWHAENEGDGSESHPHEASVRGARRRACGRHGSDVPSTKEREHAGERSRRNASGRCAGRSRASPVGLRLEERPCEHDADEPCERDHHRHSDRDPREAHRIAVAHDDRLGAQEKCGSSPTAWPHRAHRPATVWPQVASGAAASGTRVRRVRRASARIAPGTTASIGTRWACAGRRRLGR